MLLGLPLLPLLSLLLPPPHAAARRSAPVAAVVNNASLRFMRRILVSGARANNPLKGLSKRDLA